MYNRNAQTAVAVAPRQKMRSNGLWLLAAIMVALFAGLSQPLSAYADPGDLDTSFSTDGKQTTDFFAGTDTGRAVAIQSDGKIIVGGSATTVDGEEDFALTRYNVGGALDSNFDGDGKVTTDFFGDDDSINALVIQSDGKIVAAGYARGADGDWDVALARYNPDGSLDTGFSGNGKQVTDFNGGYDTATSVALQSNGKIVIAGIADLFAADDFALARYNVDGALDGTFSLDGKVTTDFGADEAAQGLAIQADGKLVAAGYTRIAGPDDFALARYTTGGVLDTGFSFDGMVTTDFNADDDIAYDVLILPDGKIVTAGLATWAGNENFGLARYLTDGTLDNSFSINGKTNTDLGLEDEAFALLRQADGKLVTAGASGSDIYGLVRYTADGNVDTTFSSDGIAWTDFDGIARAGALQTDGKIVVAGNSAGDFGVARFLGDPPPTPTPTASATRTPSRTPTRAATATRTPIRTATATRTRIVINTPTRTLAPTQTPGGATATTQPTNTPTSTSTSTRIPTNTPTRAPTQTPGGPTATTEPTNTPTAVATATIPPEVTPSPTSCPLQFEDVPPSNTFYANVRCLACQGIINGYPCGAPGEPCNANSDPYFRPGNNVTRGQIAKIVSNSAGFIEPVSSFTFEDVPPGSTFYDFVERLASRGVMSGYACGGPGELCVAPENRPYFRPNATATRGQLAKITSIAANFTEPVSGQTFEDVTIGSTFYEYIERLASRGVMNGYACGGPGEPCVPPENRPYFRPGNNVTRGQTSKIVGNTFFPGCNTP